MAWPNTWPSERHGRQAERIIDPNGYLYAPPRPRPLWWPDRLAVAQLEYSYDLAGLYDPRHEAPYVVTAAIAPSGPVEAQAVSLTVERTMLRLTLTGGQPTRHYRILFVVALSGGRVLPIEINQRVLKQLPTDKPAFEINPAFGTPIQWVAGGGCLVLDVGNSGYGAIIAGF
jgi:hypothetical protein